MLLFTCNNKHKFGVGKMNNIYEVRIGNKTYTIGAHSFDNVIGHLYEYAETFGICSQFRTWMINKPHIRLAPKVAK